MDVAGKVVIVTGSGSGIGRALARRFAEAGAAGVAVADRDGESAAAVAEEIGGLAVTVDVSQEDAVNDLVAQTRDRFGPIDIVCSNAGIATGGSVDAPFDAWQRTWEVNVMAHVHAAKAVLPEMVARGTGYLVNTASAAGLLTQIGSAPYAVTKHAAVALAEWLSITYGDKGVRVSCICPQGVKTNMLAGGGGALLGAGAIEPEVVAEATIEGMAAETFLILPHPEVREYFRRKGDDYDRWLRGMRRLQQRTMGGPRWP